VTAVLKKINVLKNVQIRDIFSFAFRRHFGKHQSLQFLLFLVNNDVIVSLISDMIGESDDDEFERMKFSVI